MNVTRADPRPGTRSRRRDGPPRLLGSGDRVIHLDLHLGLVVLADGEPVIIDWSNGAAGLPGADVAMAARIMRISEVDGLPLPIGVIAGRVRRDLLVHSSMRQVGHVVGGTATVLSALRRVIGPLSMLVVPAQTQGNSLTSKAFQPATAGLSLPSPRSDVGPQSAWPGIR